ncbi:hypothetical protein B0I35DRAFT_172808 [Stachybotrys elegans]|uniref:Rhodopsin domain-containing protein n=1 Tax=Stachybotrys elegans TaxID=80388 RepID=A0A8K0SWI8_9HYPO|nr:hypothetical protein B0I35DRAFT_172808 [Stachybotrys elegans]
MLLSLALLLTILRLFLRLVLQRTRLTLSDWLLVASCLDGIALFTTDTLAYRLGGMADDWDPNQPVDEQIALMKVSFAGNYFYDTGIYLPKLALLALYYRLVPPTMPTLRKVLYAVTGIVACFAITTIFVDTFWCGANVSVNWDLDGTCSSFTSMDITRIDWSMNIVSDILIFSLPFPLLRGLQISKRYRVGLLAIFSSGIITLAANISRFVTIQAIHSWTNVYVLSMTELVAAIIVVCLPALKSLVRRGVEVRSSAKRSGDNTVGSHTKLSSGRDHLQTGIRIAGFSIPEGSESEVELNAVQRPGVIYKSQRVSVTYYRREDTG